uniref:V-ATPase subunit E n=1 Tax=Ignisphaera aggregans TaxID=334771 RepID=A0A7J3QE84_9CREN
MESLENLKKTVLERAFKDAENRIGRAEEEARRIIEEAIKLKKNRIEDEKRRIEGELNYDAKIAEARLNARLIIHNIKDKIVKEIEKNVTDLLTSLDKEKRTKSIFKLLDETLQYIFHNYGNVDQITVKVSEKDFDLSKQLKDYIKNKYNINTIYVEPAKILGGVIVEIANGFISIDNSYDSRLLIILKNKLPSLVKEIFQ